MVCCGMSDARGLNAAEQAVAGSFPGPARAVCMDPLCGPLRLHATASLYEPFVWSLCMDPLYGPFVCMDPLYEPLQLLAAACNSLFEQHFTVHLNAHMHTFLRHVFRR